jgi:hypothetical protein
MSNLETIRDSVDELENKAKKIESDYTRLVRGDRPRDGLRDVAMEYERWYNPARKLVDMFLKDKLKDFEYHYRRNARSGRLDGLSEFLRNRPELRDTYLDKSGMDGVIRELNAEFDYQRSIVNSIPDVIKLKGLDITKAISTDIVESEIVCAERIFRKYKDEPMVRVSGVLTRIALERHLKTLCQVEGVQLPQDPSLNPIITALHKAGKIDDIKRDKLMPYVRIGNNCAHANTPIDRSRVGELISFVKQVLADNY